MRIFGMILSLGAIVWVMYQAADGGEAETMIPAAQQESLDRAKGLEQSMQDSLEKRMEKGEEESF